MIDDVRIYMEALTPEQAAVVATGETLTEIARIAPAGRTAGQAEKLRLAFLDQYAAPEVRDAWQNVKDLERERAALWDSFPTVMVMEEMEPRRDTFRLIRGAYDVPGERVDPGVPAVLPPMPDEYDERPAGVRPLARRARPSAHRPRGGEPLLADVLRDRPGQDVGELRAAGGVPQPSRAAGLAGDDLHRLRLGRQGAAAGHRDQLHLPPGVESDAGGDSRRTRRTASWRADRASA